MNRGMNLPAGSGVYVSFVRCFALENHKTAGTVLSSERWSMFLDDLRDVLLSKDPQGLTHDRLLKTRQWAAAAALEHCKPAKAGADVLRVAFPVEHAAANSCAAVPTQDRRLGPRRRPENRPGVCGTLQIAMRFRPGGGLSCRRAFQGRQPRRATARRGALLFAYLDKRLTPPPPKAEEKLTVLSRAATFLSVFPQLHSGPLLESDAKLIIKSVLDPAMGLADTLAAGEKGNPALQLQLADLYEAAYDFSDGLAKISWQDKTGVWADGKERAKLRVKVLTSAIDAARQGLPP